MAYKTDDLYDAAVALPETERAVLVVRLLDSIGGTPEVMAAQAGESVSRLAAMEAGDLEVVDNDAAFRLING